MARISYDEQTAAAFKAVREVPRGPWEWREAVRRHLRPSQGLPVACQSPVAGRICGTAAAVAAAAASSAMRSRGDRGPPVLDASGRVAWEWVC